VTQAAQPSPKPAAAITVVVALAIAVPVTHDAYTGAAAAARGGADPSLHVRKIVASFPVPARPGMNPNCDMPDKLSAGFRPG